KVVDFGIASAAGDAALTTGDLLGTAAYLAPERVLGRRATPAAGDGAAPGRGRAADDDPDQAGESGGSGTSGGDGPGRGGSSGHD
ncbi:MAG TPA: hypothetical protein VK942_17960, partial [Actinomycetes bacterium]|nr:hypothetical protein [Actinomycetes bacterium]